MNRNLRRSPGGSLGTRFAVALACTTLAVPVAHADSHAEAVVLFDQGIKDLKAGRIDKACGELQASLDLVKDSGTKGALARCNGLAGRVATAWLLWRELADTAPKPDLRSDAAAQAAKLEARLPHYTLKLAAPADNLVVEINGKPVATSVSVPVPIDPGKLTVNAVLRDGEHDASQPWSHEYAISEGQTLAIEIPKLAPLAPKPAEVKPVDVAHVERPAVDETTERRHRRHVVAVVLGAVAIGAGGAAGYFGYDAHNKWNDAKSTCGGSIGHCPTNAIPRSQAQVDNARTAALVSTITAAGAGALAVAAIVVWATAPSAETRPLAIAPTAGNGTVGFVLGGHF